MPKFMKGSTAGRAEERIETSLRRWLTRSTASSTAGRAEERIETEPAWRARV